MKTILLGLNELNFKYIDDYIKRGFLNNFKHVFEKYGYSETHSEDQYEFLEPWIQWVTISTGKTYEEHKVFRLGDITNRKDLKQIFEEIEKNGFSVGAISPFNVENRLEHPVFFAPDPWTQTKPSGSFILKKLSGAISQAVNDNARNKVTLKTFLYLILGFLTYTKVKDYLFYVRKIFRPRLPKGTKAIFLDKLLGDVFLQEWKKKRPDFSNLFLNSGAHIQHHYMYNSACYSGEFKNPEWYCPKSQDPLLEILKLYDQILGELIMLPVRLVILTGLHQEPYSDLTYYWRLKDHKKILNILGINKFSSVFPRMSRDFLINFDTKGEAESASRLLMNYRSKKDGINIFSIDNRGSSLFVELTYPHDIKPGFTIEGMHHIEDFNNYVSFVAIKNGEHNGTGYVVDTEKRIKGKRVPLKDLHNYLLEDFA